MDLRELRDDSSERPVIEIDGTQQLADPDVYRRDRRKDNFLQEDGCSVVRFLAEDVGARLDDILDGILRAMADRKRLSGM